LSYVDDCDALFKRALGAGGKVVPHGELRDQDEFMRELATKS
jgi:hypothetical protein